MNAIEAYNNQLFKSTFNYYVVKYEYLVGNEVIYSQVICEGYDYKELEQLTQEWVERFGGVNPYWHCKYLNGLDYDLDIHEKAIKNYYGWMHYYTEDRIRSYCTHTNMR